MKPRIVGLLTAVLLVVLVLPARADPVVVTAGMFDANQLSPLAIPVIFSSSLFDVSGVLDLGSSPRGTCQPCVNGQVVAFGTTLSGPDPASGTINGTLYPSFTWEGVYQFTSPRIEVPGFMPGDVGGATKTVTVPFSMTGNFNALTRSNQPILVNTPVTGQGNLTVTFREAVTDEIFVTHAVYSFSSTTPAATPEPASLLLLASGVAGMALRRSRRQRQKN